MTRKAYRFDTSELMLLAFVVVGLLAFFAWQTGMVPPFLTNAMVLGAATAR